MKELSIEEKATRYDEAIEIAKEINNEHKAQPFDIMLKVFPELKESEDERISKSLSAYFAKFKPDDIWDADFSFGDIVAWLEKQSKASKVEESMREVEEKAKAFTETHKGETSEEILAQMKGEQKPAWSEEDEIMIKVLDSIIRYIVEIVDKDALERFGTNREELFSWLKSLRPQNRWKPSDKQMNTLWDIISNDNLPNNEKEISQQVALTELYEQLKKL